MSNHKPAQRGLPLKRVYTASPASNLNCRCVRNPVLPETQEIFEIWAAEKGMRLHRVTHWEDRTYLHHQTEYAYIGFVAALEIGKQAFQVQFNKEE